MGEIQRNYKCWCGKAYGSDGSLNQHKKLKKHFGTGPDDMRSQNDDVNCDTVN